MILNADKKIREKNGVMQIRCVNSCETISTSIYTVWSSLNKENLCTIYL